MIELTGQILPEQIAYEWSKAIETGDRDIDDQHHKIIDFLNQLKSSIGTNDREMLTSIAGGMRQYAINHFAHEAKLMETFPYDAESAHKKAHAEFVKKVDEFQAEMSGKDMGDYLQRWGELTNFVYDWLVGHITTIDREMLAKKNGTFHSRLHDDEKSRQTCSIIDGAFKIATGIEVASAQIATADQRHRSALRVELANTSDRLTNLLSLVELRVEAYGCPAHQLDRLSGIRAAIRTSVLEILEALVAKIVQYGMTILSGTHGMPLEVGTVLDHEMARINMMVGVAGGMDVLSASLKSAVAEAADIVGKISAIEKRRIPDFELNRKPGDRQTDDARPLPGPQATN